jgi:hypothetical protein
MLDAYENARLADPWSGEVAVRLAEAILADAGPAPTAEDRVRALDLYEVARKANALREQDFLQMAYLLTQLGEFEAADLILKSGVEQTNSQALRTLQERNGQSLAALKKREDRLESLTGRERTYEEAYLLHLRRRFLQSNYVLEADIDEHGFHEPMWLLLARNKHAMGQLDRFIQEYRGRDDVLPGAWAKLAQQFEDAGDSAAADAVMEANSVPAND